MHHFDEKYAIQTPELPMRKANSPSITLKDRGGESVHFKKGNIHERWARQSRAMEHGNFLHCGMKPRRGLRTEIILHLDGADNAIPVRLTGVVTSVGDLPGFLEWSSGDNFSRRLPKCSLCGIRPLHSSKEAHYQFPVSCVDPHCYTNKNGFIDKDPNNCMALMMKRSLLIHGTLHNQEVTCYAYLHPDSENILQSKEDPYKKHSIRRGQIYKILLRAHDDNPFFRWKVDTVLDVTEYENFEDWPEEFRDFAYRKQAPSRASTEASTNMSWNADFQIEGEHELDKFLDDLRYGKMDSSFDSM